MNHINDGYDARPALNRSGIIGENPDSWGHDLNDAEQRKRSDACEAHKNSPGILPSRVTRTQRTFTTPISNR